MPDAPTVFAPTAAGPFFGLESRETYQTPSHAAFALNVDFSQGLIEPRKGFERWTAFTGLLHPQLYVAKHPSRCARVLWAGPAQGSHRPIVAVLTLDGAIVSSVDLTADFGEAPNADWSCSFIPIRTRGLLAEPQGLDAVLINTPQSSYLWVPGEDETVLRRPDLAVESERVDVLSQFYVDQVMGGGVAWLHNDHVFYAGFPEMSELTTDGALPTTQPPVPESWILPGRGSFRVGPNHIAISDANRPYDIPVSYHLVLPAEERVVGGKSFREQAIVCTDRGIYSFMGEPSAAVAGGAKFVPVVRGVGLTHQSAMVEAAGVLYLFAQDGIYAFDGQQARKLSEGIDPFWTGEDWGFALPAAAEAYLRSAGGSGGGLPWPWHFERSLGHLVRGAYYQTANQIWWGVPIRGGIGGGAGVGSARRRAISAALVLQLPRSAEERPAFSFYLSVRGSDFVTNDNIVPGASYFHAGQERFFVSGMGYVWQYPGTLPGDGTGVSSFSGIPLAYVSPPVDRGDPGQKIYRNPFARCRAYGKTPSSSGPQVELLGETSTFDAQLAGVANTDRQAWTGAYQTHPYGSTLADDLPRNNAYFTGTGLTGSTGVCSPQEWFTQMWSPSHVEDRWCRLAFTHFPANNAACWVAVQAYGFGKVPTGAVRT